MFRINRFRFLIAAAVVVFGISSANAQVVIYDWKVKGDAPKSYPTITRRQAVTIRIENVNDILFSYRMRVTQRRFDSSDFDSIAGLAITRIQPAPGDAVDICDSLNMTLQSRLDTAQKAITDDDKLPIGYARQPSHPSIPLQDSLDAWLSHAPAIEAVRSAYQAVINKKCSVTHANEHRRFMAAVDDIIRLVNRPHFIEESHTLDPATHVSVTVDEVYDGATISTATFTFDTEDVLTLSAGAMFSRIQDRTYEARKDPTSTLNTLTVTGNSQATPSLVALLNYSLGALRLDGERAGLALSAGPVLRVGGKSETSSFGFFTGISGHLHRRIFVTPGFHFGEFADFPVGFGNGSAVPSDFGALTPVKRWTARFGLAITFKTKSFDAFGSGEKQIGGDEAGGGETKSKDEKPDAGENASNTRMMDAATALRYVSSKQRSQREVPNAPVTSDDEPTTRDSYSAPQPLSRVSETPSSSVYVVGSPSSEPITVISINARTIEIASDERVSIETSLRVSDYFMYFKAGRFHLVLPRAKLQVFQDGLQGHAFRDAVIEKRGSDLVLSFVLKPGTTARIVERPTGLDLVFAPSSQQ